MWRLPVNVRRARGFTLIELLVAMAVMVLLMTASFGAVRIGNRVLESGIESAGRTDRTRTAVNLLRRQFAQVVPFVRLAENDEPLVAFSGNSASLRFIAPALQSDVHSGLYLYALRSEQRSDSAVLELAYAPFNPGQPGFSSENWRQYVLFESEGDFDFSYFGAGEPEGGRRWQDHWDTDRQALPELVRISAASPPADTGWSTLTFGIHTDYRE